MQKIFVVEDDESIREMLLYAFEAANFEAEGFGDGGAVLSALEKGLPDMLLLDIMLPGSDGLSLLRSIRGSEKYREIPVIMLTAKSSEIDRIRGLDFGADDYIVKPFSVLEVISRVRAVLRRTGGRAEEDGDIEAEGIVLSRERHKVFANGREITLTYREFELLHYLLLNKGIVLSRDRLLEQVWGFDYGGESRTVDMHIKTLRQKLGEAGAAIVTVRNIGYRLGT